MNRILFNADELDSDGYATFGGVRAEHVLTVLHGEVGQTLKTGVVDGLIGTGVIERIEGEMVTVKCVHDREAPPPWIDLVLAPPRPRAMKRLLPQLAAMGVGRIVLVGAAKVEKAFWGAQLLKEEIYRPLLVDGLMQAGTTALPTIQIERAFGRWLEGGRFEEQFGRQTDRIVAHPECGAGRAANVCEPPRLASCHPECGAGRAANVCEPPRLVSRHPECGARRAANVCEPPRLVSRHPECGARRAANVCEPPRLASRPVLAIGPEGGWTDDEVAHLEAHGFRRMSLGPRILRTDTATIALLARLMPEADAFSSTTQGELT